ncbi:MAG: DUF1573 domain-containing protein, partial [Planctomycetota bacterium]
MTRTIAPQVLFSRCVFAGVLVAVMTIVLPSATASAAAWADQLFPVKMHDFGTVAVAAKTEFVFPVVNTTNQTIRIRGVRASCGCTTPIVETPSIPPNGSGSIRARFNTRTFKGKKGATLTVVLDQPQYAEVRLRVDGYIRSDMVFHPGELNFGTFAVGSVQNKDAKLYYAGRPDWQIVGIESPHSWMKPAASLTKRDARMATYELSVELAEDAPTGYFQEEVVVVTNDRAMPRVPFLVTGQVRSMLSVSPAALTLGVMEAGQTVTKRLIVRGVQPFVVDTIDLPGWTVECKPSADAKSMHVLTAKFTPSVAVKKGEFRGNVVLKTAGEKP